MINNGISVVGNALLRFCILKGEKIINDYINHFKIGTYMAMLKKAWMIKKLFKEFSSFFNELIPCGNFHSNYHLLSLDGLGSHAMIEIIEHVQQIGLDIITLSSHMSHALQTHVCQLFQAFQNNF
jgi:hypothetical protein